ncbi:MAG: FAD-dependent oxidoreductase [Anaerolineales bacterium]|nr:FAD-dependent oxidoreductase [Anaerolineales bacterium]
MSSLIKNARPVAVIGAGPAGLYAAKELADAGYEVALLNRDIKLGGLAEYGIYYDKHKMKSGLRKQFHRLMEADNIHYYGNVKIAADGDLSLDDLRSMGFAGILVTVGAQGTKWLGLPGEHYKGVYHAKDLVYHYNKLPPFSQKTYQIGESVALIGVGNVMTDIAHWTIRDLKVDKVTAVARRGPAEIKFTKKEWQNVAKNLDRDAFEKEFAECVPVMEAVGQDVEMAKDFILAPIANALEPDSDSCFYFDFFANPTQIVGSEAGKVTGLEVEETKLEARPDGTTKPVGTGVKRVIPADTVIFCIGDRVDADFGLPLNKWQEFAKNPNPKYPVEDTSYEAYDPENDQPLPGIFLAGWAREASYGLVGIARKDGTNGSHALMQYLDDTPGSERAEDAFGKLEAQLGKLGKPVVSKADWLRLSAAEQDRAAALGLEEFKFGSNDEMLAAISMAPEKLGEQ